MSMHTKLAEQYENLSSLSIILRWAILEFEETLPPYEERPFLVAGLVAVYHLEGEGYPTGTTYIGSAGDGPPSTDPEYVANDLVPYHVPSFETFKYLHKTVQSAEHVSSYPRQLFELPPMSEQDLITLLRSLPSRFGHLPAYYFNGEFIMRMASFRCIKIPNPQLGPTGKELVIDDTNYLLPENGGHVFPGVLLECRGETHDGEIAGKDSANIGVAISRGDEFRVTCSSHMFDHVEVKVGYHGDEMVGELEQTIGEDIGLMDPLVPISNRFFSFDTVARTLVKTMDIADDDIVCVDSCFTGPQKMLFVGTRKGKGKRRMEGPSYPHFDIIHEQGIYTSSDPVIPKPPIVRLGMRGTPLLRVGNKRDRSVAPVGDILGFFLWLDQVSSDGRMLYSFAQPCDPLIEAGWQVADIDSEVREGNGDKV